jgi:hypothetical protein
MTAAASEPGHDEIGYDGLCNALKRQPEYDGDRCELPAGWGTVHVGVGACRKHGGSTRNHVRFAQVVEAQAYVDLFGGKKNVSPEDSLLDLVQRKAAEAEYWRYRVSLLAEEDLLWGTTKVKTGGDDHGTTQEAKPAGELVMLHKVERDLADYSAAAIKSGVQEKQVRAMEMLAQILVATLTRVLDRLSLTEEQQVIAGTVVPDVLRSLDPVKEGV